MTLFREQAETFSCFSDFSPEEKTQYNLLKNYNEILTVSQNVLKIPNVCSQIRTQIPLKSNDLTYEMHVLFNSILLCSMICVYFYFS